MRTRRIGEEGVIYDDGRWERGGREGGNDDDVMTTMDGTWRLELLLDDGGEIREMDILVLR